MTIKKEEVVSLGIVLKTHPYKESDSLVTVYFKDYGKMTLIARGVKKLKVKMLRLVKVLHFQSLLLYLEMVYQR